MATANLAHRASVERLYPRAAWEQEAAANRGPADQVRRGLRIDSEPDPDGKGVPLPKG